MLQVVNYTFCVYGDTNREFRMRNMGKKKPSPEKIARGLRLKQAREDAGLNQEGAAAALTKRGYRTKDGDPLSGSLIGNWEQGTRFPRNIDMLIDLADIYGAFLSWILDLPEAPVDRRQGKINVAYKQTDERGRESIWRNAESQPPVGEDRQERDAK